MKYPVKEVAYTALVLDTTYDSNVVLEHGNKAVCARRLPRLGSYEFAYDEVDKYRFGCTEGRFTYKQLLGQIEAANVVKEVDALLPIKGGNPITTEIVEESDSFYILKGGKAVAKANYTKGKSKPKDNEGSFGLFIRKKDNYWNTNSYYFRNNDVGSSKEDIVEVLLRAKAIIDFIEDKGDYAPEKLAESVE